MRISDWSSDVCSSDLKVERPETLFHESNLTPERYPSLVEQTRTWVESILEILDRESRIAMSDARAAATYGNRLTALAYSRSWMENPVSALTPDARKREEKKSAGTGQNRVVKATKRARMQQETDYTFPHSERAINDPTHT